METVMQTVRVVEDFGCGSIGGCDREMPLEEALEEYGLGPFERDVILGGETVEFDLHEAAVTIYLAPEFNISFREMQRNAAYLAAVVGGAF
jgi:hypothetical protein